jgi:hypothetical protein
MLFSLLNWLSQAFKFPFDFHFFVIDLTGSAIFDAMQTFGEDLTGLGLSASTLGDIIKGTGLSVGVGFAIDKIINSSTTQFITPISDWLSQTGSTALSTLEDSAFSKDVGNVLSLLKSMIPGGAFPDGNSTSLPSWTSFVASEFAASMTPLPVHTDPIVLDLSSGGTGVELTSIDNSSAYFDLHDTGTPVHTGWVGPTTGILVNPNLDGSVTSIENLFGNSSTNGFTALQAA